MKTPQVQTINNIIIAQSQPQIDTNLLGLAINTPIKLIPHKINIIIGNISPSEIL